MTLGEVITSFRQAKNRRLQLHALSELTLLSEDELKTLLLTHGVSYKEFPRGPRAKKPVEVKPEDQERLGQPDPTPAPAAKPARKTKASPPPPEKIQQTEAPPVQTSPLLSGLRGLLTHRDELAQELAKIDAQLDEMRRLLELNRAEQLKEGKRT